MNKEMLKSIVDACTALLKTACEGNVMQLRVLDIRKPQPDKDCVVSWGLNGATLAMPAPVKNEIGRVDTFVQKKGGVTEIADLMHLGIRIGTVALVKFSGVSVIIREVDAKPAQEDPLTGLPKGRSVEGGIYADARANLEAFKIVSSPKTLDEMQAAGLALALPAT